MIKVLIFLFLFFFLFRMAFQQQQPQQQLQQQQQQQQQQQFSNHFHQQQQYFQQQQQQQQMLQPIWFPFPCQTVQIHHVHHHFHHHFNIPTQENVNQQHNNPIIQQSPPPLFPINSTPANNYFRPITPLHPLSPPPSPQTNVTSTLSSPLSFIFSPPPSTPTFANNWPHPSTPLNLELTGVDTIKIENEFCSRCERYYEPMELHICV